jgi:ATP-dependent helicase/nuclease subunit B
MKRLICGNFPDLQARFVADVSEQRKSDPLAPLDVLVGGQLMRLSLRRELARSGCSHANVNFLTLNELVQKSAAPILRERGLRPVHDVECGPLMKRALAEIRQLQYFHRIADRPGFRNALWRTLDDLRGAGVTAKMLATAARQMRGSTNDTLRLKLADLAALWNALEALMKRHKLVDHPSQLSLVPDAIVSDEREIPLIIYGLTELTHLERRFLERTCGERTCSVYLPYHRSSWCAWLKEVYDWLVGQNFETEWLASLRNNKTSLSRVQAGLFEEITPHDILSDDDVHGLLIVCAPGRDREAEEIARETLFSPLTTNHPERRIGVLLRGNVPYVPLLRDELARAKAPGYFHQCVTVGETLAGKSFALLAGLLNGDYKRADVMEFLLASPVKWPSSLGDSSAEMPVTEWNQFSLQAGIASGEAAWVDGLNRLRNQIEYERKRREESGDDGYHAQRLVSLANMARYFAFFFRSLHDVKSARTWTDKCDRFWGLFTELVETNHESDALQTEWDAVRGLGDLCSPSEPGDFAAAVGDALGRPYEREGKFQASEPTVATLSEAAGVLFDEVMIPGLVEKECPRPPSHDPLLLDDERKLLQLRFGAGFSIPLRDSERDRESFLFHSALNSARHRAVLLYPRRDETGSRERLASTYLLKIAEAATGKITDYDAFDRFVTDPRVGRRISASRLHGLQPAHATNGFQYDTAKLGDALERQTAEPVAYLLEDRPLFRRGIAAEQNRFRQRDFTRFDGWIEDPRLRARFGQWMKDHAPTFSPTRMERYATCPFQYFGVHVLGLEDIEEPEDIQQVDPMARGALVHDILERFYRSEHASGRLPLKPDATERLVALARKCFVEFEQRDVTGLFLLWRIERQRIVNWLEQLLKRELEDSSGYIPSRFEERVELAPDNESGVAFGGKIDRVDVNPNGTARVIDYKTGAEKEGMKDGSLCGGRALQLPIYRLAAEATLDMEVTCAAYYYLSDKARHKSIDYTREHWEKGQARFFGVARTIREGVTTGVFFPFPEDRKCDYCPVRTACGAGKLTPKWRHDLDQTAAYRAMSEVE